MRCILQLDRYRKISLTYKLFIMLQVSSVLPYSKKLKKQSSKMQIMQFNERNPENIVFFTSQGGLGPLPPVGVPLLIRIIPPLSKMPDSC